MYMIAGFRLIYCILFNQNTLLDANPICNDILHPNFLSIEDHPRGLRPSHAQSGKCRRGYKSVHDFNLSGFAGG